MSYVFEEQTLQTLPFSCYKLNTLEKYTDEISFGGGGLRNSSCQTNQQITFVDAVRSLSPEAKHLFKIIAKRKVKRHPSL